MTPPDELTAPIEPTPASEAAPAPAPESSRPEAPEPEPTFNRDLFASMLDQTRKTAPIEAEAEPPPGPEKPPARTPRPEAPAAPAGRYAGRFETPEALEAGYRDLEKARQYAEGERGRAEETAKRLDRLLVASLQGQRPIELPEAHPSAPARYGRAPAPEPMPSLDEAVTILRQEHERLGLADPEGNPLRYARALAVVLANDELARNTYVGAARSDMERQTAERRQVEELQSAFFQQHPDLRSIRLDRLRQVAEETEEALRRAKPDSYGSPDFIKEWFDATAREARATFRTEGAQAAPSTAGRTAAPRSRPETPRATGAPFAESPSPRTSEPALTGQAFHLARVFGRGA